MKKLFTFMIAGLLSVIGVQAQTDITPSRYVFSNQAVGPFSLDKQIGGANPPDSDADVVDHWNNGFLTMGNGTFENSLDLTTKVNADNLNSGFQVFDMGGDVGKVLMFKGSQSTFPYGVQAKGDFNPGWWNLGIFTDPANTPAVPDYLPEGVTPETATPEQMETATAQATVRLRIVFHIHENTIRPANSLFDILGYTYTNNHKTVNGALTATQKFKSGDFADVVFNEETEEEEITYNPNKWIACEYDYVAAEAAGAPLRFSMRFGDYGWAMINNYTLLIKEISVVKNPTGAAVEKEELTLVSDPVNTSVGATPQASDLDCYASNGILYIKGLEQGDKVAVYSITGGLVKAFVANQNDVNIPLNKGFYVVKAGNKTAKVAVQ